MIGGAPTPERDLQMLSIAHNERPNRLWAFPVLGGAAKNIVVLPVALWLLVVDFAAIALSVINAFVVFFTGKYWAPAYALVVGGMRLRAKANCFILGLSDAYPGFSLDSSAAVRVEFPLPARPNRLLAFPLLGGLFRFAVLVPFFIFLFVLGILVMLVFWLSWIPVLFMGKYPDSLFAFMVYTQRLQLRLYAYTFGLSETYPLLGDGLGPDEWGPGRHDRVFRPLP